MIAIKYLLELAGIGMLLLAAAMLADDYIRRIRRARHEGSASDEPLPDIRWRDAARIAGLALLPLLAGMSIQIIPGGMAGVKVNQLTGVSANTLYTGTHFIIPLFEQVVPYNTRDQVYMTAAAQTKDADVLRVQTKEGLAVGLVLAVRYRLEPKKLGWIHANLPQPVDHELVPPVVASVFREAASTYLVRELFAGKREEVRRAAADLITRRLLGDGILVKEVMLRDIILPAEYAKGLEGLLIKEQENERMAVEIELKQKQVRTAELEAEAQKARDVKQAEAQAQVVVLQAKAQSDAMQYTLPLKEKQIQQTRLEAAARKESTVQQAEANAQAKVIDGKAELERRKLMNEADVDRVERMAQADSTKMKMEAAVLKENPLLIQKIIAERLSDKVQIMMVPNDGKFFFANDVLRSAGMGLPGAQIRPEP